VRRLRLTVALNRFPHLFVDLPHRHATRALWFVGTAKIYVRLIGSDLNLVRKEDNDTGISRSEKRSDAPFAFNSVRFKHTCGSLAQAA
jgi:hypothetical protein